MHATHLACTAHCTPAPSFMSAAKSRTLSLVWRSGAVAQAEDLAAQCSRPFEPTEPSGRCAICSPDLATPSFFAKPLRSSTRRPAELPEFGLKAFAVLTTPVSRPKHQGRLRSLGTQPTAYDPSIQRYPNTTAPIRAVASPAALQLSLHYTYYLTVALSIPCQPSLCDKP